MKKISCVLLTLILSTFIMVGCDDTGSEIGDAQIEISNGSQKNQQGYADDETTGGFTFTAKSEWTATVSEQTRSVSWLRLLLDGKEKYSGDAGTFTLTIELDTNYTGETRSATIVIRCGDDTLTITVTQQGTKEDGDTPEPEQPEDFSAIIIAALDKTAQSNALTVSMTETYTSGWPHNEDKTTATWLAYDRADSRKCIEYRAITDNKTSAVTIDHLRYLENNTIYYIEWGYVSDAKKFICGVEPDAFWGEFEHEALAEYLDYYCDLPPRDWSKYTWAKKSENKYTAEYFSASGKISEDFVITLDGGRISSIAFESFDFTDVVNEKESTKEITFEYSATPTLPAGFTKDDFVPVEQYQVKIVWSEEFGESVFYTGYRPVSVSYIGQYGDYGLASETLWKYTPKNEGKSAEYYFDESFSDAVVIGKPIYVDNDDTVIYVKWVAI